MVSTHTHNNTQAHTHTRNHRVWPSTRIGCDARVTHFRPTAYPYAVCHMMSSNHLLDIVISLVSVCVYMHTYTRTSAKLCHDNDYCLRSGVCYTVGRHTQTHTDVESFYMLPTPDGEQQSHYTQPACIRSIGQLVDNCSGISSSSSTRTTVCSEKLTARNAATPLQSHRFRLQFVVWAHQPSDMFVYEGIRQSKILLTCPVHVALGDVIRPTMCIFRSHLGPQSKLRQVDVVQTDYCGLCRISFNKFLIKMFKIYKVLFLPPIIQHRTQTLCWNAEQKVQRTGRPADVRHPGRHRRVHSAARPERPEQGMRIRDVRQQAIGNGGHQGEWHNNQFQRLRLLIIEVMVGRILTNTHTHTI